MLQKHYDFFSIFLDSVDRDLFESGQCFFIRSKLDFISNFLVFTVLKAPLPVCVRNIFLVRKVLDFRKILNEIGWVYKVRDLSKLSSTCINPLPFSINERIVP